MIQSKDFDTPFLKMAALLKNSATVSCTSSYMGHRGAIFKSTRAQSNATLTREPRRNVMEKI